jgi:hypothetical protein
LVSQEGQSDGPVCLSVRTKMELGVVRKNS